MRTKESLPNTSKSENLVMPPYLYDLLNRMSDNSDLMVSMPNGGQMSNPNPVSSKATNEASTISDLNYVTYLQEVFEQPSKVLDRPWTSKEIRLRESAYYLLAYLYSNTKEKSILEYMIARLAIEKSRWMLFHMLGTLGSYRNFLKPGIPADVDITNIIDLVDYKHSLVWEHALVCLENTHTQKAEDKIIEVISESDDLDKILYACHILKKIGTRKSIPYLKHFAQSQKDKISENIVWALSALSDKTDLPFFIDVLIHNNGKLAALDAVLKYGDKSTVPVVENRIKQFVSRKRKIHVAVWGLDKTDLTQAMEFLAKYVHECPSISKLYTLLMTKKYEMLFAVEQQWLKDNASRFTVCKK